MLCPIFFNFFSKEMYTTLSRQSSIQIFFSISPLHLRISSIPAASSSGAIYSIGRARSPSTRNRISRLASKYKNPFLRIIPYLLQPRAYSVKNRRDFTNATPLLLKFNYFLPEGLFSTICTIRGSA